MASSPPSVHTSTAPYRFRGARDLLNKLNNTNDTDILIVHGVSPQDLREIKRKRKGIHISVRIRRYLADSKILIITIPTVPHEALAFPIFDRFRHALRPMGLSQELLWGGSAWLPDNNDYSRNHGEPDACGFPIMPNWNLSYWPSFVIESSFSASLEDLRQDMRFWFDLSAHQVKIVILAKLDIDQKRITLENWVENPPPPRQGATTTRSWTAAAAATAGPLLVPSCSQAIAIDQIPGITSTHPARCEPESYVTTGGDLRLDFRRLFLREPKQGEGDVIVPVPALQSYAVDVWRCVYLSRQCCGGSPT